ncbi:uncharacterized protein G2W53_019773 [Senna tora]|uniref:Uncharacterized protein n=1 Tax=Senna tora TaxID=362788 RepID=A0A834TVK2_9FABA|nr:uncharacterized protein G2W53_019773 [Senna tora]
MGRLVTRQRLNDASISSSRSCGH